MNLVNFDKDSAGKFLGARTRIQYNLDRQLPSEAVEVDRSNLEGTVS